MSDVLYSVSVFSHLTRASEHRHAETVRDGTTVRFM